MSEIPKFEDAVEVLCVHNKLTHMTDFRVRFIAVRMVSIADESDCPEMREYVQEDEVERLRRDVLKSANRTCTMRWLWDDVYECSECHVRNTMATRPMRYCQWCGARIEAN